MFKVLIPTYSFVYKDIGGLYYLLSSIPFCVYDVIYWGLFVGKFYKMKLFFTMDLVTCRPVRA